MSQRKSLQVQQTWVLEHLATYEYAAGTEISDRAVVAEKERVEQFCSAQQAQTCFEAKNSGQAGLEEAKVKVPGVTAGSAGWVVGTEQAAC